MDTRGSQVATPVFANDFSTYSPAQLSACERNSFQHTRILSFPDPLVIVTEMKSCKWLLTLSLLLICAGSSLAADSNTPLQRWFYCAQNLAVDKNIDALDALFRRAAKAGYTYVLLADSKFARL